MRVAGLCIAVLLLGACASSTGSRLTGAEQTPTPSPTASVEAPRVLRFAAIGDYGSGWAIQHEVAQRMCRWRERRPFEHVVTTGDNIYPDGSKAYFQDNFFEPYDCLLSAGVKFHASLGNHDRMTARGRDVLEEPAFGIPRRNYVWRKAGVRFVVADSSVLDRQWLGEALRAGPLDRWTVVVFHHPVYSGGTTYGPSGASLRDDLPALFRERGVDLVLNGHDHLYSASRSLRGVRYVTTGGGGASVYRCGDYDYIARCAARNHFVYVVAAPDRIKVRAVPIRGPAFHRFATVGRD